MVFFADNPVEQVCHQMRIVIMLVSHQPKQARPGKLEKHLNNPKRADAKGACRDKTEHWGAFRARHIWHLIDEGMNE
jgi:hypothetical protein